MLSWSKLDEASSNKGSVDESEKTGAPEMAGRMPLSPIYNTTCACAEFAKFSSVLSLLLILAMTCIV